MRTSVPSSTPEENVELEDTITRFLKKFGVGKLLQRCNAVKMKGIAVLAIFTYLLSLVFRGRSMYMDMRSGSCPVNMSRNTAYRFLNDGRINWERFERGLAGNAIAYLDPLTDADRQAAFVVDDTICKRDRSKQSELSSLVFDHSDKTYHDGYRLLTLGWNDGNTFIPIQGCLLASADDDKLVGPVKECDGRTLAAQRRERARRKATDLTVEMLHEARKSGIRAQHALFDTWFFSPKMARRLLEEEHLHVVAMCRKSDTMHFLVGKDEESAHNMSVKQIYATHRKRPGRAKYKLCVDVRIPASQGTIPARLVFVANRRNSKEWLVLVSTDMSLTPEEIICLYGKRWAIEDFFKICKQCLKLTGECHSLSYDALNAHVAIVFTRYILLAVEQRCRVDIRTVCELCLVLADELQDITFAEALASLMGLLSDHVITDSAGHVKTPDDLLDEFIRQLPLWLRKPLIAARLRCA